MPDWVAVDENESDVRAAVRAWLGEHWRPGTDRRSFLVDVVDAGWAAPTWPVAWYGRNWPPQLANVVRAEFTSVGAPGAGQDEYNLWAGTALAFGSDELKRRFIRPLLTDSIAFCLLYSEPGAGSDLASLQTRAERDGDEWLVNGHKVWTSGAQQADYGMLIARTNPDAVKHAGLTFFFFPMKQPGVVVRPLKQITGEVHFNEVLIADARVPDANRVGGIDAGWLVLQTALAYERAVMGGGDRAPGRASRTPQQRSNTAVPTIWSSGVDLADLARSVGRANDPIARQSVTEIYTLRMVNAWNTRRAGAATRHGSSSPLHSMGKLAMSRIVHRSAAVESALLGAEALLVGEQNRRGDEAIFDALNAFFTSIGGGTDQIQRTILGERVLGLPKEPDPFRTTPFSKVPKPFQR
jgi:alkylation response protein AidB-like acyl-CoA dehydrogenase